MRTRFVLGCIHCLIAVGMAVPSTPPAVNPEPQPLRAKIIILQSYHAGLSWSDSVMQGIQDTLATGNADIQISGEYLDARRIIEPNLAGQIRDVLEHKLKTMSADLILCVDNAALDFMLQRRKFLFPQTPIVFCGINDFLPSRIAPFQRITGIAENLSVADTVNLAVRFHPGLNEIIVIGRTTVGPDQANRASFVEALPRLPKSLKVTFWDDLPMAELKIRLSILPSTSAVFINGLIADNEGRQLMYAQTTEWICSLTAVPVYSLWEVYFGHGIVGGKLVSGYHQGQLAADYALRILKGQNPDTLPVINGQDANRYMFDYRQLVRFGISQSRLPPEFSTLVCPPNILPYP